MSHCPRLYVPFRYCLEEAATNSQMLLLLSPPLLSLSQALSGLLQINHLRSQRPGEACGVYVVVVVYVCAIVCVCVCVCVCM